MQALDTIAYWLGWVDMVAAVMLVIGTGLPTRLGRAPRGMVRILFYGIGVVACRYDLQPALCDRLQAMGYRFYGDGDWRLALALPGQVKRSQHRRGPKRGRAGVLTPSSSKNA